MIDNPLDELFENARRCESPFPRSEVRDLIARNTPRMTDARSYQFTFSLRIILGGAGMAIVGIIIVLSLNLFRSPEVATNASPAVVQQPPIPLTMPADSHRYHKNVQSVERQHRQKTSQKNIEPTDHTVGLVNETEQTQPPSVHFASWTPKRINAIRIYSLDSTELLKLGIFTTQDGFIGEQFNEAVVEFKEMNDTVRTYRFRQLDAEIVTSVSSHFPSPVLVTNSKGEKYSVSGIFDSGYPDPSSIKMNFDTLPKSADKKIYYDPSGYYSMLFQNLIPIRVNKPTGSGRVDTSGDYFYIYWYDRTPELLKALPPRVRRQIESDDAARDGIDLRERTDESKKTPLQLEAELYPNPSTSNSATLKYSLPEPRRVAVSLYDIEGKRLKEFPTSETEESGTKERNISLDNLKSGVYLLALTTDKGEQSIRRIVVGK